jgi:perosamine synthetase
MSNLQAAIGCAQMERVDELIYRKREIMSVYRRLFAGLPGVSLNPEQEGLVNGAWMPTIVFAQEIGITREKLQAVFAVENADARIFFWPLSSLPMFEPVNTNMNAWDIPTRAINLPSYHEISNYDIRRVSDTVVSLYKECTR